MIKITILLSQFIFQQAWAHHTKDHLMLQADPQQVIAATQQGTALPFTWLIWFLVFFLIVIGIIRQWKK